MRYPDLEVEKDCGRTPVIYLVPQPSFQVLYDPLFCSRIHGMFQNGKSSLIRAAEKGHAAIVDLLLQAGANKNAKDNVSFATTSDDIINLDLRRSNLYLMNDTTKV
jgi:hypothetical protein